MRRQRTRRGLKRRVRKNKTMRGGLLGFGVIGKAANFLSKGVPITLETFKKEGYGYAENVLYTSSQKVKGYELSKNNINHTNLQKIKNDYNTYYNSLQEVDKKITKWIPNMPFDFTLPSVISNVSPDSITLLVPPKEFNEIIDYITSNSIENKNIPLLTKQRNQLYGNFGNSFKKFIESKTGGSGIGNLAGAAEGVFASAKEKFPLDKFTGVFGRVSSVFR